MHVVQGRSAPLLAGRKSRLDRGGVRVHVLAQHINVTHTAHRVHQPIEDRGGAWPFWLKGKSTQQNTVSSHGRGA